jgi:hypothetical protein
MGCMRIARLCIAAACAVGLATTASASAALPEFTGPFGKPFTSTITPTLVETVGGTKVTCKGGTDSGEVTGPQTGFMTMIFTGCSSTKVPCNSPGSASGVIATSALSMQIGYIAKATKKVGADLVPATGGLFMSYGCGTALQARVTGSVIGLLVPVNKPVTPSKVFYLHFVQSLGVQKVTKLEGAPIDVLETSFGGPFEGTGLKSTDKILFGETVTLIA